MNKRFFIIRLLTFPLKFAFMFLWFAILSTFTSFKWLWYGSHEIYDGKNQLIDEVNKLIAVNEKMIEKWNKDNHE